MVHVLPKSPALRDRLDPNRPATAWARSTTTSSAVDLRERTTVLAVAIIAGTSDSPYRAGIGNQMCSVAGPAS